MVLLPAASGGLSAGAGVGSSTATGASDGSGAAASGSAGTVADFSELDANAAIDRISAALLPVHVEVGGATQVLALELSGVRAVGALRTLVSDAYLEVAGCAARAPSPCPEPMP